MHYDHAVAALREHWKYNQDRRDQLEQIDQWRKEADLQDAVTAAVIDAAKLTPSGMPADFYPVLMKAVGSALAVGSESVKRQAIAIVDSWLTATHFEPTISELSKLMNGSGSIPGLAAHRLWTIRRRAVQFGHAEAFSDARAHRSSKVRFFASMTLAFDASHQDRCILVESAKKNPVPTGFGDVSDGNFPGTFCCGTERSNQREGDGREPKYVDSFCRACGSFHTDVIYHHMLLHTIGIIETTELRCEVCGFFTVLNFET